MLRLVPPGHQRFEQVTSFEATIGGSELNTAVAAQALGLPSSFVTRLPNNPLGRLVVRTARQHGVGVPHIIWGEEDERLGVYYLEFGSSPRPNRVLYDRKYSAFANWQEGQLNWEEVFKGKSVFHTSGITPALSPSCTKATKQAVRVARQLKLTVSIDINYRVCLWTEEEARNVMTELAEQANLLITTEEDTKRVFGITGATYEEVAEQLAGRFNLDAVAITLRETHSVTRNRWSAIAYSKGEVFRGPTFEIDIVDRLGAGDAFSAGFLTGYLKEDLTEGLQDGVAISALKQTHPGDLCYVSKGDVERLLAGGNLRIQR